MGERTGSRVFQWVWSYVLELHAVASYIGTMSVAPRLVHNIQ
ncbi:hypothetical protein CTRU02_203666 [Colletotrichum truncatum]|uniref:Uncharacterized protein n=1 Tax=Colletotrichum truncatum TaxID=5467 RepID=A0ACC3Z9V1_COLTU